MRIHTQHNIPDLGQAKRILCIQPHYDDNDIGAGGTLAALHDAGAEIFYLTITDDLVGVIDLALPDQSASAKLKREQAQAGEIIGVSWHSWLGYPDAGKYDYYEMRNRIIRHVRLLRPDYIFTCDPWLTYEAHRDHVNTGLAAAEASYLHAMPRLKLDEEVDRDYTPYQVAGIAFYFTSAPNATVDITDTHQRKHRALDCYQTQFSAAEMAGLHQELEILERGLAQGTGFEFGEPLKVLRTGQLHVSLMTQHS